MRTIFIYYRTLDAIRQSGNRQVTDLAQKKLLMSAYQQPFPAISSKSRINRKIRCLREALQKQAQRRGFLLTPPYSPDLLSCARKRQGKDGKHAAVDIFLCVGAGHKPDELAVCQQTRQRGDGIGRDGSGSDPQAMLLE
jgi:hypothetical protein